MSEIGNMIRRRFGRTELEMPVFSCGGMRYQHAWQDTPLSDIPTDNQENLEATISRALEVGINHIETARGYGSSERQLGEILPKYPRDKMIIQTKVGPKKDPKEFKDAVYDSIDRLKLEYVDLFALHGINTPEILEWCTKPGGCFEVAQELREEGKLRFVGFSTHGPTNVIIDAIQFGNAAVGEGFDYVNLHWYYIMQKNWPAIEEATKRDMGMFIISPSDKGGKLYEPSNKMVELCQPHSPMAFNNLFCLSHKEVHTLSIGAARPSDFDAHLKALPFVHNAHEEIAPIITRLEEAMKEHTGYAHPTDVMDRLPEHTETPGNLNLQLMLWLYNMAVAWDMTEYGKMRFNMFGNGDHWFPGGKAAELRNIDPEKIRQVVKDSEMKEQVVELAHKALDLLGGEEVKRLQS